MNAMNYNPLRLMIVALLALCSCSKPLETPLVFNQIRYTISEGCAMPDAAFWSRVGLPVESVRNEGDEGVVTFSKCVVDIPDGKLFGQEFVSVELPEGLKSIGDSVFYKSSIKSIRLPESLNKIGKHTFSLCTSLETVTIPDNVTELGESAFVGCEALESVVLSSSLKVIEKNAFAICGALREIVIPDSVELLKDNAFYGCNSLEKASLGKVVEIGYGAFAGAIFNAVTIPDSTEKIGDLAFYHCRALQTVTIGEGVRWIGNNAFGDCRYLSNVTILASTPPVLDNPGIMVFSYASYKLGLLELFVPAESLELYKTSEYFTQLADCIEAIKM